MNIFSLQGTSCVFLFFSNKQNTDAKEMIFDCSATTCLQYTNIRNNLKVKVNKPVQRNHNMKENTNFLVHYDDTRKLFFIEKKHVLRI